MLSLSLLFQCENCRHVHVAHQKYRTVGFAEVKSGGWNEVRTQGKVGRCGRLLDNKLGCWRREVMMDCAND